MRILITLAFLMLLALSTHSFAQSYSHNTHAESVARTQVNDQLLMAIAMPETTQALASRDHRAIRTAVRLVRRTYWQRDRLSDTMIDFIHTAERIERIEYRVNRVCGRSDNQFELITCLLAHDNAMADAIRRHNRLAQAVVAEARHG